MKKNILFKMLIITMCHCWSYSQTKLNKIAPLNPVALAYTLFDYGLVGPVRQVDKMFFDSKGRVTSKNEEGLETYVYKTNTIEVKKYGATYVYILNANGKIVSWSTINEADNGIFKYDAKGNMVEQSSLFNGFKLKTTYLYDFQDRLVESTEWSDGLPYITNYNYVGTPNDLKITVTERGELKSQIIYYYKNGILENSKQFGVLQRDNIKYDSHANWMSYFDLVQSATVLRFVAYY